MSGIAIQTLKDIGKLVSVFENIENTIFGVF